MSLLRTALRLQAIETLNSDPVIAALVKGRVYDSRISAFDHQEPVPTILLTSEETKGTAWDEQNGGAPFKLHCDLVMEIAMNALTQIQVEGGGAELAIGYAASDRELEADLDLIEDRAIEVLTRGQTAAARLLREAVLRKATDVSTSRFATDQTGEKFAVHLVTLRVQLFTLEPDDLLEPATGPFAALPEPLRTIAAASDPAGSVRSTCERLAANLAPALPVEPAAPFAGLDAVLAPPSLDPAITPDRAADLAAGRTLGLSATIAP